MFFFFFKQKTAYEMRISDWSSDVCSSDLVALGGKVRDMPEMLAKAAAVGVAEIRIIRALAIRALALARLRAEVDGGAHPATVVAARSSGIFWKERDAVPAQLPLWDSVRIPPLMSPLLAFDNPLNAGGTDTRALFSK